MYIFTDSLVQALSKPPIKFTEAVYTVKLISYLQIHTHICTLLFLTKEFARKRYSLSEQVKKTHFTDDSSEHLWLVIPFISSTASCVIGYNAQCYKRVCLWLSASQRTQIWI